MESVSLYVTFSSAPCFAQRWSLLFYRNVNEWKKKIKVHRSYPVQLSPVVWRQWEGFCLILTGGRGGGWTVGQVPNVNIFHAGVVRQVLTRLFQSDITKVLKFQQPEEIPVSGLLLLPSPQTWFFYFFIFRSACYSFLVTVNIKTILLFWRHLAS